MPRFLKLSGQTLDGNFPSRFLSINVHDIKTVLLCATWHVSLQRVTCTFGFDVLIHL